jgi:hypothetical protein
MILQRSEYLSQEKSSTPADAERGAINKQPSDGLEESFDMARCWLVWSRIFTQKIVASINQLVQ